MMKQNINTTQISQGTVTDVPIPPTPPNINTTQISQGTVTYVMTL